MRISWSPYNCLTCLFIFHSLLLTEIKISGARNCLQLFDVLQSYSGTKQNAEEATWSTEPWPSKTFLVLQQTWQNEIAADFGRLNLNHQFTIGAGKFSQTKALTLMIILLCSWTISGIGYINKLFKYKL